MTQPKAVPRWWGPVLVAIAAVLFAAMAVFGRLAAFRGIPGSEVTIARFATGLLFGLFLHGAGIAPVRVRRPGWLLIRGIGGGLGNLFLFLALASVADRTPMTNAVILGNSYFVFAPIFGALLIKERLRYTTVVAVIIAMVGIYFVVNPEFGRVRIGDVYALLGGIFSGLAIAAVRELRRTESAASVFFALNVVGTVVAIGVMFVQKPVVPDMIGWLILVGVAASATAAQLLQTYAFRFVPAGEGSVIAMTTVVYSSAVGLLLLGERFTWNFALGAALVFASAGYLAVMRGGEADV